MRLDRARSGGNRVAHQLAENCRTSPDVGHCLECAVLSAQVAEFGYIGSSLAISGQERAPQSDARGWVPRRRSCPASGRDMRTFGPFPPRFRPLPPAGQHPPRTMRCRPEASDPDARPARAWWRDRRAPSPHRSSLRRPLHASRAASPSLRDRTSSTLDPLRSDLRAAPMRGRGRCGRFMTQHARRERYSLSRW